MAWILVFIPYIVFGSLFSTLKPKTRKPKDE